MKKNEIEVNKFSGLEVFVRQFKNPLLLIFIISTVISFLVGQKTEALAIWLVMTASILLGFWNEYQAEKVVNDLVKKITFNVQIVRKGIKQTIPVTEVQINDEIYLHPGSIVPADAKLTMSEGLEVNESILTGESLPSVKKDGDIVYMGTLVVSGNAHGIVNAIGMDTKFGKIAESDW